eukprot:6459222-Amphidinium_carterae.3
MRSTARRLTTQTLLYCLLWMLSSQGRTCWLRFDGAFGATVCGTQHGDDMTCYEVRSCEHGGSGLA